MTVMKHRARVVWFDPTNSSYHSPQVINNTGTHVFTPPGTNAGGLTDWVLLMTAQSESLFFGAGTTS